MMTENHQADQFDDQQSFEDPQSVPTDQVAPEDEESMDEQAQVEAGLFPKDDAQLINDLASPDEAVRAEALENLLDVEFSSPEILRALERVAAQDPSETLRDAALVALQAPVHQNERLRNKKLSSSGRKFMRTEIRRWEVDEIITPQQAALLQARYPQHHITTAASSVKAEGEQPRPVKELLLSDTALTIALYLGAFFVVMAAFIFAIAIEQLRVPILVVVGVTTYVAAFTMVKRLPQASFVFFTIGSFLLPITAWVLMDQVNALQRVTDPYWTAGFALLTLVWVGGTVLYRSRLFSILALWSASAFAFMLAVWLGESNFLIPLLVAIPTLLALYGASQLRSWKGKKLFWPLFVAAIVQQCALLAASAFLLLMESPTGDQIERAWWLVVAFTWLLGFGFFAISQLLVDFILFPILAVAVLVPVPLFVLGGFDPSMRLLAIAAWFEGLLLALSGQGLSLVKHEKLKVYSLWLMVAGVVVFAFAAILGLIDLIELGIVMLVGITLVYLGLTYWQKNTLTWIVASTAALCSYLFIFNIEAVQQLEVEYEFVFLVPALLYLAGELAARKMLHVGQRWYLPVRILGLLAAALSVSIALVNGVEHPWNAVIVFSILAVFSAVYALWDGRTLIGALATTSLAICIPYLVMGLDWDHWLELVYGLAIFYWGLGMLLLSIPKAENWSVLLRVSGLVLGTIGAITAPLQGGALAVLGTALVASFFVVEAVRLRNVWLCFPANLLYLGAYFITLIELDINEPQYFSIGAALIGIVMHYLLVRAKQYLAAGITGVIAQLILLSTTYVQLVSSEKFTFFLLIFLQSLILLVYGLIIRARSFVFMPIIFVVLSVITVAFSVLSDVGTILLIGCTGAALLGLGVLGLLLRERISKATAEVGERMSEWRW